MKSEPQEVLGAMIAQKRAKQLSENCPLAIAEVSTDRDTKIRLVLKFDSLRTRFISVVELHNGYDSMGKDQWVITTDSDDLTDLLSITSVHSIHALVVPMPAADLITAGNSLAEFVASICQVPSDNMVPIISDKDTRQKIVMFLDRYRKAYQFLVEYQSQQPIQ